MKLIFKFFGSMFLVLWLVACSLQPGNGKSNIGSATRINDSIQIIALLDSFNEAAAKAEYDQYFNCLGEKAVFMGTDATEYWTKEQFMIWAKPYFDSGKAWSFQSLERHIYFDQTCNTAWFDELLNTQMKICRGSGVLIKKGQDWKIQQYVLSVTVPNSKTDSIVRIKSPVEDLMIKALTQGVVQGIVVRKKTDED